MRRRLATLGLMVLCSLAVLPSAFGSVDDIDVDYGVPDYAYEGPYRDLSELPDVPRRTTFKLNGRNTIVASTWYTTWNGRTRRLIASYPAAPQRKQLPFVLVFHGAGGRALCDRTFGNTPGEYGFIVACIDGQGVRSRGYSYGAAQHLADNAKVLDTLRRRLPGLRIDRSQLTAAGGSMGGQESLLFAAVYPQLAQTVVAMDMPTDIGRRFWKLPRYRQIALFNECLGTPSQSPECFAARSPMTVAGILARSSQRVLLYWSVNDEISPAHQAPAFAAAIRAANPNRQFLVRIGNWGHCGAWAPVSANTEWLADAGIIANGHRASTRHPAGWRILVDRTTWIDDLPAYDDAE
jgi:pimeloyl-ACP methyl ester carboxylesterase